MNSTVTAGGQQALECTVSVVPFLTVAPTLQWVAPGNSEVESGYGPSLTHTLDPVRTSDAGQYTCQATVDIASVGVSVSGQSSTTLTVQSESPGHSGYLLYCYSYSSLCVCVYSVSMTVGGYGFTIWWYCSYCIICNVCGSNNNVFQGHYRS